MCRAAEWAVMNCDATILVTGSMKLLDGEVHGARRIAVLGRLRAHGVEHDVHSACRGDYLVDMAIDGVFVERVQLDRSGRSAIRQIASAIVCTPRSVRPERGTGEPLSSNHARALDLTAQGEVC